MAEIKPFSTTSIGSVPFVDAEEAVSCLKELDIPACPQLVKLSPWEDMFLGALDGLPALRVDREARTVRAKRADRENDLADFYAGFMAGERDFLALSPEAGRGFDAFIARAARDASFGPAFLKAQVIGPITFGQMVLMEDEANALVDDQELLEATALALGGKAAWMAAKIRALGRTPIIFIDEPGLTSFGSAFSTLTAETVINAMGAASGVARADGPVLIGCHICGNTDWGMVMDTGIDIVNFDSYAVMEQFSLYPKQIRAFLEKGGYIAWGLVPAGDFDPQMKAPVLAARLKEGWLALDKKGLPYDLTASRAILCPACGLGGLSPELARGALRTLSETPSCL